MVTAPVASGNVFRDMAHRFCHEFPNINRGSNSWRYTKKDYVLPWAEMPADELSEYDTTWDDSHGTHTEITFTLHKDYQDCKPPNEEQCSDYMSHMVDRCKQFYRLSQARTGLTRA